MSSFIEFQAVVMAKLCSIESRLDKIENALGVSDEVECFFDSKSINQDEMSNEQSLKNEISDLQNKLAEIKSLF